VKEEGNKNKMSYLGQKEKACNNNQGITVPKCNPRLQSIPVHAIVY
jgi:hypothetical protein